MKEGDVVGGHFEIISMIGEGGLGVVYRAFDKRLHRHVAIKLMRIAGQEDLFEREAMTTAQVRHPNVVVIHEFGREKGAPYLVLELLEGETLNARMSKRDIPVSEAFTILIEVSAALAAAHDKGVAHRDLSPNNVFITRDDQVKVLDFGLAALDLKRKSFLSQLHSDPASIPPELDGSRPRGGTAGFVAPEQLEGSDATGKSDIWSAGALLFLLIARELPFNADSLRRYAEVVRTENAPSLRSRVPTVNDSLSDLVARMLDKDPAKRPAAKELRDELRAIREDIEARMSPAQRPKRKRRSPAVTDPFRPLRAFQPGDADLFFGRDAEIDELIATVRRNRLIVLHGASGTGKSSLLHAGLRPRLEEMVWLNVDPASDVTVGPADALAEKVRAELRKRGHEPTEARPDRLLAALSEVAGQPLLLVLDQFEEIFQRRSKDEVELAVSALAGVLCRATTVAKPGTHVLIAVRDDYFGHLRLLKEHLSGIFNEGLLLEPLGLDATLLAIERPFEMAGFDIPQSLVRAILTDLSDRGQVSPVELQLVCHALYERAVAAGGQTIEPNAYDKLGGAGQVLANHLARVEGEWSSEILATARDVLARLVSAEGARQPAMDLAQLGSDSRRTEAELQRAFEHLIKARIVEPQGEDGGMPRWRIAHDRMALAVWKRMSEEERRNIALRDTLRTLARQAPPEGLARGLWFLFGVRESTRAELLQWHDAGAPESSASDRTFLARLAAWDRRAFWGKRSLAAFGVFLVAGLIVFIFVQRDRLREERARTAEANAERELERDPGKALAWMMAAAEERGGLLKEDERSFHEHWLLAQEAWRAGVGWIAAEHEGEVRRVAFSPPELAWMQATGAKSCPDCWPNKKLLLSVGTDGVARVLDLTKGGRASPLQWHSRDPFSDAVFSPDGRWIVASSYREIVIWNSRTGESRTLHKTATANISRLAISADGKWLAWNEYADIEVWDTSTWNRTRTIKAHKQPIKSLAFSPRDGRLFSSDEGGQIRLTGVQTGESSLLHEVRSLADAQSVSFSLDGTLLAAAAGDSAIVFVDDKSIGSSDASPQQSGKLIKPGTSEVTQIVIYRLGKMDIVALGTAQGEVSLWYRSGNDWKHGRKIHTFQGAAADLSFSRDGAWILSTSIDGDVVLKRKVAIGRVLRGHEGRTTTAVLSADGRLVASGGVDGRVRLWLVDDGRSEMLFAPAGIKSIAAAQPETRLVAGLTDGNTVVWRGLSPEPVRMTESTPGVSQSVCSLPDGRVASGGWDGTLIVQNEDATQDSKRHAQEGISSLVCLDDGRLISAQTHLLLWLPGKDSPEKIGAQEDIDVIRYAPEGLLLLGLRDGTVAVWDINGRRSIATTKLEHPVLGVAPLGPHEVAVALYSGRLLLWNWVTGERRDLEPAHAGPATDVAAIADIRLLASASVDGVLKLRWVDSGASRAIRGHQGGVEVVAFSEDGRYVISGGMDTGAGVWPLPPTEREAFLEWLKLRTPWVIKDDKLEPNEVPPLSDAFGGPDPPPPSSACIDVCLKAHQNETLPDGETMETCVLRKIYNACKP